MRRFSGASVFVAGLVLAGCAAPVAAAESPPTDAPSAVVIDGIPAPAASLLLAPAPASPPPKIEGHLARQVCTGLAASRLKKERPHKAACCYPAKELIARPVRAVFPDVRACYLARTNPEAEGRVVFQFRVEQDGTVQRVCTGDATSVEDKGAVQCMVEAMRKIRYPARDDADVDLCGLLHFDYPVIFER